MKTIKFSKIEKSIIIFGVTTTFINMLSFVYGDCQSITAWSYSLLDCLFSGNLMGFYEYIGENIRGAAHGNCTGAYFGVIAVAIWNLPAWGISKLLQVENVGKMMICLVWTKVFFYICFLHMIYIIRKLCSAISNDGEVIKYVTLFLLGAGESVLSVAYAGQNEIVYIYLIILALYFYYQEKYGYFYIFGIMSVTLCPIMFLPYMLAVIVRDKNIVSIISKALLPLLPSLVFGIIYSGVPRYKYADADYPLEWFFGRAYIQTGWGKVSLLAMTIVVIFFCAYIYVLDENNKDKTFKKLTYLLSCLMGALCFLGWDQYYRTFMWLPFAALMVACIKKVNFKMGIFLLLAIESARLLVVCAGQSTVFVGSSVAGWIYGLMTELGIIYHEASFYKLNPDYTLYMIANSVAVSIMLLLHWICHERNEEKQYPISYNVKLCFFGYYCMLPFIMLIFALRVLR